MEWNTFGNIVDYYDEIEGARYARRGYEPFGEFDLLYRVIPTWISSTMLGVQVRPTGEELRKREEEVYDCDVDARRARFRCKDRYTTIDEIEGWESYVATQISNHRPAAHGRFESRWAPL
jgi:hypothetical protein